MSTVCKPRFFYLYGGSCRPVNRFNATKVRLDEIKQTIIGKQSNRDETQDFIKKMETQELMTEFDKNVWLSTVDCPTVYHDGRKKWIKTLKI
ncbi:hypothetical protein KJY77_05955 [Canibacter sp. lx-72]|uniref:hypothetical protein n=1 Tax=Canibacter zhuwentaonis TaxID=2837491 RepID=UPI001BDCA1A6|nr:hypothetical protein [Canibacter zhuwentaonis]MBT1018672.1 hypothetical protein [Canibacter zhuwentaonis]